MEILGFANAAVSVTGKCSERQWEPVLGDQVLIDEQKKMADLEGLSQHFDRGSAVVIVFLLTQKQVLSQKLAATVAGQQATAESMLAGAMLGVSVEEKSDFCLMPEALTADLKVVLYVVPLLLVATVLAKDV